MSAAPAPAGDGQPGAPRGASEGAAPEQLTRAAASGFAWQGTSYLIGRLLVLAATVTLARLLTPAEFGLVTLAVVFIGFVEVVSDFGVSQALVYLAPDRRRTDAALACSLASGALLAGGVVLTAPFAARFLGDPAMTPLLQVLALSLLVGSAGLVPDALLRRDLRFRRRTSLQLSISITRGVLAIVLAFLGFGPWSLVYAQLVGTLVWVVVGWSRVDHRPDLRFWRLRSADVAPLLRFGLPTAGNGLVATLVINIDYVVVSRALGAAALGFYTLAFRLPEMLIVAVFTVVSAVTFPVFSRARHDPDRLRRGYLRVVRLQTTYGLVAGLGMVVVAPMLVHVVFGPRWEPSIVPLQALALYAAFRSMGMGVVDLLKAVGRPQLALGLSLIRLSVLLPALLIASTAGIVAVAWTQAAVALLFVAVMQGTAARLLHLSPRQLLATAGPPLAAGLAAAFGAGLVRWLLPGDELVRLVAAILVGGVFAAVTLLSVGSGTLRDLQAVVRPRSAPAG